MSKDTESFESKALKHAPYSYILDDRLRYIKPKDDLEYAIGKMARDILTWMLRCRRKKRESKKYRAKLIHKKIDGLKLNKLKIRDNTSTFRAVIKMLTETTDVDE